MTLQDWLTGMFRRFRSLVLKREVEVVGTCLRCGHCCEGIILSNDGKWLKTMKQYDKLIEEAPDHARFRPNGKDDFGHISFICDRLGEDQCCTSYEDRLSLCRNYPSKSLYYRGGWLRPDCGFSYKAVTFRDVFMRRRRLRIPSFEAVLKQETKRNRQ